MGKAEKRKRKEDYEYAEKKQERPLPGGIEMEDEKKHRCVRGRLKWAVLEHSLVRMVQYNTE